MAPDIIGYDGPGGVYFVECMGGDGHIKIGYSKNPVARLPKLETGCPYPLKLIAFYKAPQELEFFLHFLFRDLRETGEWFRAAPVLWRWALELPELLEQMVKRQRTDVRRFEDRMRTAGDRTAARVR
jgi:hypothetical protein